MRIGLAVDLCVEPVPTDAQGRVVVGYHWYPAAEVAHGWNTPDIRVPRVG